MSRIDELKKEYPELNITIFDIFKRMDNSKSYKYTALMCKIFSEKYTLKNSYYDNLKTYQNDLIMSMETKGISHDNLSFGELMAISLICDHFPSDTFENLKQFQIYMEKNLIKNKDVTSYSTIEDIRNSISLASLIKDTKDLESQVIKEYEDDVWVIVRPLTFQSSVKYGASTKWCTTYKKEPHYFEKYWRQGILVYFINKVTGYKFAGYKELSGGKDLSFWNSEDSRVDYLTLDVDEYLFSFVRKIFSSDKTNKNLCSDELQNKVHNECNIYNIKYNPDLETIPNPEPEGDHPDRPRLTQIVIDEVREVLSMGA